MIDRRGSSGFHFGRLRKREVLDSEIALEPNERSVLSLVVKQEVMIPVVPPATRKERLTLKRLCTWRHRAWPVVRRHLPETLRHGLRALQAQTCDNERNRIRLGIDAP